MSHPVSKDSTFYYQEVMVSLKTNSDGNDKRDAFINELAEVRLKTLYAVCC